MYLLSFVLDFRAETGEKVYPIINGENPWMFGYVDVFHEMINQVCVSSTGTIPPPPREGEVLSPKSYVDVPAKLRKSYFLYTNFLPNYPPINIPFLTLGSFVSDENPPIAIQNFAKKRPERQAHNAYTMSM